jgi:hypothetical protein
VAPVLVKMTMIAASSPYPAMWVMTRTLRAPAAASFCRYQKPTRKNEQRPMISQLRYMTKRSAE